MRKKTPEPPKKKESHAPARAATKPVRTKARKPAKAAAAAPVAAAPAFGLHNLKVPSGAHHRRKILGRGPGSGHGKTSTRGSKGQTSRSGRATYPGFEGGQMPLIRKIPKRGFTSLFKKEYQIVNVGDLERAKTAVITLEVLEQKGLIKDKAKLIKILGDGEIKTAVTVSAHAASKSAVDKIQSAGGKVEIVHAA